MKSNLQEGEDTVPIDTTAVPDTIEVDTATNCDIHIETDEDEAEDEEAEKPGRTPGKRIRKRRKHQKKPRRGAALLAENAATAHEKMEVSSSPTECD